MVYRLIYYNIFSSALMLLIINALEWHDVYGLMFVFSINISIVYGILLSLAIKRFDGIKLSFILLIGYCMRLVLPALTRSWGALNGDVYYFVLPNNDITDYMFPSIAWMNIYYMIFYWCVYKWEIKRSFDKIIKPVFEKWNISFITIPIFVIGLIFNIIVSFIPASLIPSIVFKIFGNFVTLAVMTQMFNTLYKPSRLNKSLFYTYLLASTWQATVFGFYKGPIVINMVYYILYYFLSKKYNQQPLVTPKFVLLAISLILFIDLLIYPFMSLKRTMSAWDPSVGGIPENEVSNWKVALRVIEEGTSDDEEKNSAGSRLDAIPPNTFFYKECCVRNLRTLKVAKNNIELLVPRVIKPDKHGSEAGLMADAYINTGSFDNYDLSTSYAYIGQFASSYLMGGPFLVILLAFINGWFIAHYYNFLLRHINNLLAIIQFLPLLILALMGFEEVHDGGLLNMGLYTTMMILIFFFVKVFPNFLRIKILS